ncbi:MAG: hypothetical protein H6814_08775 [Phycisphaeraceae bacterium]|nr:hypothetical protein [Phycisphaeraceae bacterium]
MTEQNDQDRDYEVGYGKPPEHSRWKKGQSGNPKGRPKKIKDFEKLLDIELSRTLQITEGGRQVSLTKRELILKTLVNDALKGDLRAMKMILPFIVKQQSVEGFEPDTADREALRQLLGEFNRANEHGDNKENNDA